MADEQQLLSTKELANLFGLSDRRIQQLVSDGVITAQVMKVDGHQVRRYDLFPTVHAYVTSLQDKMRRGNRTDKEIELKQQKLEADIALRESQGELHRLKTAIAAGDYISVEEVKLDYAKFFVVFKKFVMSLPARIGGMLSGSLDPLEQRRIEKELSRELAELLNSFSVAGIAAPRDVKGILSEQKDS